MKLNKLHYTVEDGIAVVQLDYPKNLNAIDEEMPMNSFMSSRRLKRMNR